MMIARMRRRLLLGGSLLWMAACGGGHAFDMHKVSSLQSMARLQADSCRFHRVEHFRASPGPLPVLAGSTALLASKRNGGFGGYNDDAFGLVFVSALIVDKDNSFATVFGVLSAVAAISVRFKIVPDDPRLPGAVALSSLLLSFLVPGHELSISRDLGIEVAVTTVSVVWGLVQYNRLKSEANSL